MRFQWLFLVVLLLAVALSVGPSEASGTQQGNRPALVQGMIVDQYGEPLPGVLVVVEYTEAPASASIGASGGFDGTGGNRLKVSQRNFYSKEDGAFSHPELIAGTQYRVRFEKEGYVPRERVLVLAIAANEMGTIVMVSGDVEKARSAYDKGFSAWESGDLQGAIEPMEEVVEVFGDSDVSDQMLVVALSVLGQVYLQQQQPAEAQGFLERLQSIEPDNAIALRGLGSVYAMGGDLPRAIESFEHSLQIEPDHSNALFMLGMALHFTGQACEAVPHLQASIEIEPNYPPAQERLSLALNDCGTDAKAR
ncbi:MAG: tetratricopeptide repeat protein [Acidobacteriota bacterium]|jgi:tetratricopeptide (TPR) repeat protein|nr:tetratricopeptide repeat protein [Acidobacteriota bacterium]